MSQSLRHAWLVASLLLLSPVAAHAQESIFGVLGFGAPEDGLSVRSRGMGNASTALPRIQFGFRNPASLAVFDRTGISAAALLQARTAEDPASESTQTEAELPLVQLVFPVTRDLVLGAGYHRALDFSGFIDTETTFGGDTLPVRLTTQGGIGVLSPQLGWQPTPRIRVGAGADFYTGSRAQRRRVSFDEVVAVPTTDSLALDFSATGFTVGVHAVPFPRLLLGAAYRSGVTLDGEPSFELLSGVEQLGVDVELPAQLFAGASVRVGPEVTVAAEFESARWGDFAVDGVRDPDYEDTFGGGLGIEWAARESILFLPEGTVMRAGGRTRTLPQRFGGEQVRESVLSMGAGQVVGIGASVVDLALEAGKRGDVGDNGLAERFLRLSVSISAFEQWTSRGPRGPEE